MLAGTTIERRVEFQRNERLETVLESLNELLSSTDGIGDRFHMPQCPVIFIVVCPRSGTSLMWLAISGVFVPIQQIIHYMRYPRTRGQDGKTNPISQAK